MDNRSLLLCRQALPQYLINVQCIHLLKVKTATHWAQVLSTSVSRRAAPRCEPQFSTPQGLETSAWGLGKEAELQSQLRAKSDPRDTALLPVPGSLSSGATGSQAVLSAGQIARAPVSASRKRCLGFLGSHPHLLPADPVRQGPANCLLLHSTSAQRPGLHQQQETHLRHLGIKTSRQRSTSPILRGCGTLSLLPRVLTFYLPS